MTDKKAPLSLQKGIQVTINHGKDELAAATLPVEWKFDEATIDRAPEWLLIVEQNSNELDSNDMGRRYIVRVSDAIKYLQIFEPGYHRIGVFAFKGNSDNGFKRWIHRYSMSYSAELPWEKNGKVREGFNSGEATREYFISYGFSEVDIPEGLFAKRNRSKLGDMCWKWVNWWYETPPCDECQYRRRKIFAFTLQPVLYLAVCVLLTLINFLAKSIRLFFGFKVTSFFEGFSNIWRLHDVDESMHLAFSGHNGYRVWSTTPDETDPEKEKRSYMPATPIEIAAFIAGIYFYYNNSAFAEYSSFAKIVAAIISVAIGLLFLFRILRCVYYFVFEKFADFIYARFAKYAMVKRAAWATDKVEWERKRKEHEEKQKELAEALYKARLRKTLGIGAKVAPDKIPLTFTGRVVQKFHIGYWALKAKVCRPFAR